MGGTTHSVCFKSQCVCFVIQCAQSEHMHALAAADHAHVHARECACTCTLALRRPSMHMRIHVVNHFIISETPQHVHRQATKK